MWGPSMASMLSEHDKKQDKTFLKRKKLANILWKDVKSMRYKSAERGTYRILIQADRKIYIETGMTKNSEEAEKLIKKKGI